jgi:hypothetical protein
MAGMNLEEKRISPLHHDIFEGQGSTYPIPVLRDGVNCIILVDTIWAWLWISQTVS